MKTFFLLLLLLFSLHLHAQKTITKSIKDFGAKGNGITDDQDAFVKASAFFNNRKGHGKLIIPKGIYIVGRQKFTGNDVDKKKIVYDGEYALDLRNCTDIIIEGKPGAVLKHRDSLRVGAFSPVTGEAFKHQLKEIQGNAEYARYASNAGNVIFLSGCNGISISGLEINGNASAFRLGGHWGIGRNPYELVHYGIYIVDSHDISMKGCSIENFVTDGIYIANVGQDVKTFNITIDKCKVNYCGRNGLSWLGGENIKVSNSVFSNSGQNVIQESPSAGIDIEVENYSFCRNGYFYNCTMENNVGSAITSGSKTLSSNVLFKKCTAASPSYYSIFIDAASHVFEDCKIYGSILVWYRGTSAKDGTTFRRCIFDENYLGKKMQDVGYQLGAEATAVQVDSCTFKAYTTSSYYLACHTKDCSTSNTEKINVRNCTFYNYAKDELKLAKNIAGMAGCSVFFNNRFYSLPGVIYQNLFESKCNADAGKNKFYTLPGK